ncbi:hypothetical protein [Streptomyces sp. AC550_RSS872]|uniref:hypothetical protein n=1 Tax=Streptomyces sp. AC550_RSS872 TaxID=2823689 RepID=UPI0035AC1AB4
MTAHHRHRPVRVSPGDTQLPAAAHGGGCGLVGLKERVTALGGELHTGPRGGAGWEVRAVFPARKS